MTAKKRRTPGRPAAPEQRLLLRFKFDDGTSDAIPFEKVIEQELDQLREFAWRTGNRGPYEAALRRIATAKLEAERATRRRRQGGKGRASELPDDVAALFQDAYDRLAAKGAKRIGRTALAREARSKLRPGDPMREKCREHDARRWLEERRGK